jgi:hypothetical protein
MIGPKRPIEGKPPDSGIPLNVQDSRATQDETRRGLQSIIDKSREISEKTRAYLKKTQRENNHN